MKKPTANSSCWDQYWQSGQTSCFERQHASLESKLVRECWLSFMHGVEDGAGILDLCGGNGAALDVLLESARQQNVSFEIVSIDFAAMAPNLAAYDEVESSVHFVRGTVSAMPFRDDHFDYLISQFGVEYAPQDQVASEAMRVLRSGGNAQFIMHASGGAIVTAARAELGDLDELTDEINIFGTTVNALELVCEVERGVSALPAETTERARKAHEQFNAQLRKLSDGWRERAAFSVYRDCGSILQHTYQHRAAFPLDTLLQKVRETEDSVQQHRNRLARLCEVALDERSCHDLVDTLRSNGASAAAAQPLLVPQSDTRLAWIVSFSK